MKLKFDIDEHEKVLNDIIEVIESLSGHETKISEIVEKLEGMKILSVHSAVVNAMNTIEDAVLKSTITTLEDFSDALRKSGESLN